MKVSDLIKILEEHRDKELYLLNLGSPIEVNNVNPQIVDDYLFLEIKGKHDLRFIVEMESIDEGFKPRFRSEEEMSIYIVEQIRSSREFNYFFNVGDEVIIDEEVLHDIYKEKFSHLLGQIGVVKERASDLHSYGHGTSWGHVVEWETGDITQDMNFDSGSAVTLDEDFLPKNWLSTIYLKKKM